MRHLALAAAVLAATPGCRPGSQTQTSIGFLTVGGATTITGLVLLDHSLGDPPEGVEDSALAKLGRCEAGCVLSVLLGLVGTVTFGVGLAMAEDAEHQDEQDGAPTENPIAWSIPAPVPGLEEPGLPAMPTDPLSRRQGRAAYAAAQRNQCSIVRINLRAIAGRDPIFHAALLQTDWARACR